MLLLLASMVFLLLAILAGGVYIYVKITGMAQSFAYTIEDIFTPRSANEPSLFAQTVNEIAEGIAQKTGIHINAAIRGSLGGTMKGVNAALEEEAIAGDPALAVASALPKSLKKNPIAMIGLQMLMQKALSGTNASQQAVNNNGHNNSQAQFNL